MEYNKLLPKGISDFRQTREENRYYVDKTMFLEKLEVADNFVFMTRPRRFGKSLFLSMMKDYYDINNKDNFQKEFDGLYVAKKPTPLQGKFQILYFDFSKVENANGNTLEEKFDDYCSGVMDRFIRKYADFYDPDTVERVLAIKGQGSKMEEFIDAAKSQGNPIYLIIDEYDNFTNSLLSGDAKNVEFFKKITHKNGFYRQAFKAYKPNFTRIIMFGVLPITLTDLTSGFNIATNISFDGEFNTMLGFSEDDVRAMIQYYQNAGKITMSEDDILAEMRPWYDGYCFSRDKVGIDPGIYNSNNVLVYLNSLMRRGCSPESLINRNTATDFSNLQLMVDIDQKGRANDSNSLIESISAQGYTSAKLYDNFDASKITKFIYLPSLMYYHGLLTLSKTNDEYAMPIMKIPNLNSRKQFQMMQKMIEGYANSSDSDDV